MSWQAMEAIRDHSRATGVTRTIGFVLTSYADPQGGSVFPSIETIRKGTGARPVKNAKGRTELRGGATAKTVVDARRWFVENGEAIIIGTRPSHTGTPVPVLDFSPLLRRKGSLGEPLATGEGSPSEVSDIEGLAEETPKGSLGEASRVRPEPSKGLPSEPEPEGNANPETENETEDARGARVSGLSPLSSSPAERPHAHVAAERREDEAELAQLEAQLPGSNFPEGTQRAIDALRERLGLDAKSVAA